MERKISMENTCETKASCMQKMVHKIKRSVPGIAGVAIGATGGFIYYKTVGCSSGSCPITSNPWLSIIWGSVIGYFLGSMFKKNEK
jgi:F0F1-type ATP synthase assembly protein I